MHTNGLFDFDDLPPIEQPTETKIRKAAEPEKYVRLSRIHWNDAVIAGTVRAVPLKGQKFSKMVVDRTGQETTVEVQDELVEATPQFEAWLTQQREESRYAVLPHYGEIATTPDRLKKAEDDFERLLQARVQRLQGTQNGRRTGKKQG